MLDLRAVNVWRQQLFQLDLWANLDPSRRLTVLLICKCIRASSLFPQDKEQPGNNQGFLDTSCLALTTWTLKACKPPPLAMPRHVSVTTAGLRYLSPSLV